MANCERCRKVTGHDSFGKRPRRYRCCGCQRLVCWHCCAPLCRLSHCFDCQTDREHRRNPSGQEAHHARMADWAHRAGGGER